MSLTIIKNKNSVPLCIIDGGESDGTKIYLNKELDKKENKFSKSFNELKIEDSGIFQQLVDTTKEREIGLITGASGSGKSYYINNYCIQYKKAYKGQEIYLFSNVDEDKSLKVKLNRVNIDEELYNDPLSVKDFQNSLVIMDDIDVIKNKKIKDAVYQIMNEILETGRHYNVSLLMSVHYPNKSNIRTILNECHFYVYFPWSSIKATNYVLENYLGVDKDKIKRIKKTKSRWACVFKNFPSAVITEKLIFMLTNDD